jgi:hypothetical protein
MFDSIGHHRYGFLITERLTVDDLDRSIERRVAADPGYADLLDAEVRRQRLIAELVEVRKANGLTQAAVARTMNVGHPLLDPRPLRRGSVRTRAPPRADATLVADAGAAKRGNR